MRQMCPSIYPPNATDWLCRVNICRLKVFVPFLFALKECLLSPLPITCKTDPLLVPILTYTPYNSTLHFSTPYALLPLTHFPFSMSATSHNMSPQTLPPKTNSHTQLYPTKIHTLWHLCSLLVSHETFYPSIVFVQILREQVLGMLCCEVNVMRMEI